MHPRVSSVTGQSAPPVTATITAIRRAKSLGESRHAAWYASGSPCSHTRKAAPIPRPLWREACGIASQSCRLVPFR